MLVANETILVSTCEIAVHLIPPAADRANDTKRTPRVANAGFEDPRPEAECD